MTGTYHPWLVVLSVAVAVIASYVALELATRVTAAQGRSARYWLAGGALALGAGIWSMHFIGMLAFSLPIPMHYDVWITIASMLVAVVVSGFALFTVSRTSLGAPRLLGAGLLMGAGIAGMHYTGMAAMRMQPSIQYDPFLFTLSIVIAVVASVAALWTAFTLRSDGVAHVLLKKVGSAHVMGAAIAGMHYTGMAAARFAPGSVCLGGEATFEPANLAVTIGVCTLLFLAATIALAVLDSRVAGRTAHMAETLREAHQAVEQANRELEAKVQEMAERNRELVLLSELGELLQGCLSPEEAHQALLAKAPDLFPGSSGALLLLSNSRDVLEVACCWGESRLGESLFRPDDCWAMRRARLYSVSEGNSSLPCLHMAGATSKAYVCAPLLAQGDVLGVLHLARPDGRAFPERMVSAAAEHSALSLANLRLKEKLRHQSIRDPLTGLYNRRYMEESLEREIKRAVRRGLPVGILMADVDHFKRLNDTFGHAAGDEALRVLGKFLLANLRGEDIACRFGGEELTVILPDSPLLSTQRRAEQLRERLSQSPLRITETEELKVTLSVGVAAFPEHGSTGPLLLQAADGALYLAKKRGRDRVEVAPVSLAAPEQGLQPGA